MIQKIKKIEELAGTYPEISLPKPTFHNCNPLYIDIETTGFSPQNGMIYAIGLIYQRQGGYYFHQLFADESYEEDNMLIALEEIIQEHKIDLLVHFNGQYFDIPFLKGRYLQTCLMTSLGELPQFDFYLQWKKIKAYFDLPNAKLKTIEKLLKLKRDDQMDGGQLIHIYHRYLNGEKDLLPYLLLHNEEDLLATFLLGHLIPFLEDMDLSHSLLPYFLDFPEIEKHHANGEILFLNADWQKYLYENFDSRFFSPLLEESYLRRYPLYETELFHFFSDWENYIYLPKEDTAIHHSVAQYVEPAFRKKATKKTAYIRKKDIFVEVPPSAIPYFSESQLFQRTYSEKKRYLSLTEMEKHW